MDAARRFGHDGDMRAPPAPHYPFGAEYGFDSRSDMIAPLFTPAAWDGPVPDQACRRAPTTLHQK
jgi:hypothetical protein